MECPILTLWPNTQQQDIRATHLPDIATVEAIASTGDRHISITATSIKVYAGLVTFRQWHLAAKHQWMEIIVDCVLANKATRALLMLDGALARPTILGKAITTTALMIASMDFVPKMCAQRVEIVHSLGRSKY
jgi:hypothetical protein